MNKEQIVKLSREERNKLRELIDQNVDLLALVQDRGYHIVHRGRNLSLQEHDSVFFYPKTNTFHRYSTGWSGGPVSFLTQVEDMAYLDALTILSEQLDPEALKTKDIVQNNHKKFEGLSNTVEDQIKRHKLLTQQVADIIDNERNKEAKSYLINERQLYPEIVEKMFNEHEIYQSKKIKGNRSVIFIGHSEYGLWDAVCARDIAGSSFKRTYLHSNALRGWFYDPQVSWQKRNELLFNSERKISQIHDNSKQLLVFESSIEMLSYMTLLKVYGHDINNYSYLSCGSISSWRAALETCKVYGFKDVKILFNNDLTSEKNKNHNYGKEAAEKASAALINEGIHAEMKFPVKGEDWNDCLKTILKEKSIEFTYPTKGIKKEIKKSEKDIKNVMVNKKNLTMER